MAESNNHPLYPKEDETVAVDVLELQQAKLGHIETGRTEARGTSDPIPFTTCDQEFDTGGKDAPEGQLYVQEVRAPESIIPQTPTKPTTVRTFIAMVMCRAFVSGKIIHIMNALFLRRNLYNRGRGGKYFKKTR